METGSKLFRRIGGFLIYLTGIVLAIGLFVLIILPDIEASTFSAAVRADERLKSLHCPAFLTRDEIGTISITVDNPSDREVNPNIRARFTQGFVTLVQEYNEKVTVPAGRSRDVEWEVDREDAAYNQMILGRIYQMSNYSLPSRTATCGIYVLPISGPSGQQVLIGTFAASFTLMALGLYLQTPKDFLGSNQSKIRSKTQRKKLQAFAYLGVLLLVEILLALTGNWLLDAGLAVLAATSIIGVASYSLISR